MHIIHTSGKPKRVMYNPDQKNAYIEYEKTNAGILSVYFYKVSKHEEAHEKDICEMNENELRKTLINLNIPREDTRSQMLSLFRGYINWAGLTGKTTNNTISNITAESLRSNEVIAKSMIKSPNQVEEILKIATDVNNDEKMDQAGGYYKQVNRANKDRLVFWLLYCGLTIYDLKTLKKTDIDIYDKCVIDRNGVKHKIYDQIIPLWESYSKSLFLEKAGTKSAKNEIIQNEVLDSEYLFRPVTKKNIVKTHDYSHFAIILKKIFSNYNTIANKDLDILPEAIKTSGIFYRLYLEEKYGLTVSYSVLAERLGKHKNASENKLGLLMRKWKIDYEDWKVAFGYM